MNKGLKNYTKQIALDVGNAANTSININKNDANLHISIPLITTVGLNPIQTSLIFNLQDKNEKELFGRGFKLNSYKKIVCHGGDYSVKNADGSEDIYFLSGEFNNETQLSFSKTNDNNYGKFHYTLKDRQDNSLRFEEYQDYPTSITYKNGYKTTMDFVAATKTINNGCGDEIRFKKNESEFITVVEYWHDNSKLSTVDISYDTKGYISELVYKNLNNVIQTTSLSFTDTEVIIRDNLTGYRVKYVLNEDRVVAFDKSYAVETEENCGTTISYFDTYTVLRNFRGKEFYTFFDEFGFPSFDMNEEGDVEEIEYDPKTKQLLLDSGIISLKSAQNLLDSTDLTTFSNTGLAVSKVKVNNSKFEKVIGSEVYRIKGEGKLTKSINVKGLGGDNTLAVLFGRQLTPKTKDSYVTVTLKSDESDEDTFSKTRIDDEFELMVLGVSSVNSFIKISLSIDLKGDSEIEIGGLLIVNKEFGSVFNYDDSGNMTSSGSGFKTSNFRFGKNGLPTQSVSRDSTFLKYGYDNFGNLQYAETPYGAFVVNEYDGTHKTNLVCNKIVNREGTRALETKKNIQKMVDLLNL